MRLHNSSSGIIVCTDIMICQYARGRQYYCEYRNTGISPNPTCKCPLMPVFVQSVEKVSQCSPMFMPVGRHSSLYSNGQLC